MKLDGVVPPSNTPSSAPDTTSAASKPIPGPVQQPVSPLTTIRAIRNQLSALESSFELPAVDFDRSVLAIPLNNAPLRAYESTLNGLLEQLDAIESDGDEEVRNTRREVVREVEKALEDLERKVGESAPQLQVTKDVEVKGYDVEVDELEAMAVQEAVVAEATSVAEGAETTEPAVAEDASSLGDDEIAPVLRDSLEPVATIKAPPASELSSDVYVQASPVIRASSAGLQDDAEFVDNSEVGESVKSGEDGWSQVDA